MMESKDDKFTELRLLICELVDGTITPDRKAKLNQILANDPDAVNHYVDFLDIQVLIKTNVSNVEKDFSVPLYTEDIQELSELWRQLANEEKSAPEVEISEEKPKQKLIQKVVYPLHEKRKLCKSSIVFMVMNTAAILFFLLFLRYAPPKGGYEVATLIDSYNAKWADITVSLEKGTRMATGNEKFLLREGYAEFLFDNQAKITIEGPAEFNIFSDDQIKLNYGRLYATVPREAIGFTVKTPSAQIVDLGTEFGVDCSLQRDTSLYVEKGKTVLIAGDKSNKVSIEVKAGVAKKVLAMTQTVIDIPSNDHLFVKKIDSNQKLIWRGQPLNLADVVGEGNGFGSGTINQGIDLISQSFKYFSGMGQESLEGPAGYVVFEDHPYIDGVFVPNSKDANLQVSSAGHLFNENPPANGKYSRGIYYGAWHEGGFYQIPHHNFRLNGKEYGTADVPAINMHANIGITFDLDAIRKENPEFNFSRFAACAGVSESLLDYPSQISSKGELVLPKASFYVLIDGEVRFKSIDRISTDGGVAIDIELSPNDRFLSLVTTQGTDGSNVYDWALFGEPYLYMD